MFRPTFLFYLQNVIRHSLLTTLSQYMIYSRRKQYKLRVFNLIHLFNDSFTAFVNILPQLMTYFAFPSHVSSETKSFARYGDCPAIWQLSIALIHVLPSEKANPLKTSESLFYITGLENSTIWIKILSYILV